MSESAEILKHQFSQSLGLPWTDILPASMLTDILEEESISYRNRVYTPIVTGSCGFCGEACKSLSVTIH